MANERNQRRKAKRAAERAAEREGDSVPPQPAQRITQTGSEIPLTPRQEQGILTKCVNYDRVAWPLTDQIKADAVAVCTRHMEGDDPKVAIAAVRNLVAMDAQNHGINKPTEGKAGSINFYGPTQLNVDALSDEQLDQLEQLIRGSQPAAVPVPALPSPG